MLSNLADLADLANGSLVLRVVLGTIEGAFLVWSTSIDGAMAGSANVKLRKLIELDFDSVIRITLTLRLCLFGLKESSAYAIE